MRELKFRVWTDSGMLTWRVSRDLIATIVGRYLENGTKDYGVIALMQYTSLKDKNGTEIYEGDIVGNGTPLRPGESHEVAFGEYSFESYYTIAGWYLKGTEGWDQSFGEDEAKTYEIVGNIYESPELLEKK